MTALLSLDTSFFHALNGLIGRSPLFDGIVVFFAQYLIVLLILVVVVEIWRRDMFLKGRLMQDILALGVTVASVYGTTSVLRDLVGRIRPLWELNAPHLLIQTLPSFPSGHTSFLFGLATFIYAYGEKRFAVFLYVCALLVGLARIAAGVHYPLDIVGGALVGVLTALAVQFVFTHAREK
jgi:undecaprenyl-diphosphatase